MTKIVLDEKVCKLLSFLLRMAKDECLLSIGIPCNQVRNLLIKIGPELELVLANISKWGNLNVRGTGR